MSTNELSPGERLILWRHRNGVTQAEAAKTLGVSHSTFRRYERDEYDVKDTPRPVIGSKLTVGEISVIRRHRGSYTQQALANDMGCSRWLVNRMELGIDDDTRLRKYWGVA